MLMGVTLAFCGLWTCLHFSGVAPWPPFDDTAFRSPGLGSDMAAGLDVSPGGPLGEASTADKGETPEAPMGSAGAGGGSAAAAAQGSEIRLPPAPRAADDGAKLLVALATDATQWQGTLVVINSAIRNTATPDRLQFRLVTQSAAEGDRLLASLRPHLPDPIDLAVVDFSPWAPRVSQLLGGNSSLRKELFNSLNFAAFYLNELFSSVGRVLYLDTDVVVVGDVVRELASRDLQGHPAAVAMDCSQQVGKYFDFEKVKSFFRSAKHKPSEALPAKPRLKPTSCVTNRGVVLVETQQWGRHKLTSAIEYLVKAHLNPNIGPLWRSGVSQPPFLIAVAGRFHDLGPEFNVRGLGRNDISREEKDFYKKTKKWQPYFDKFVNLCKFHCCPGCQDWAWSPHLSPLAHKAVILHFNGRLKPSKVSRRRDAPAKPPETPLSDAERARREEVPMCSCGENCVQECAGLWWKYLPKSAG